MHFLNLFTGIICDENGNEVPPNSPPPPHSNPHCNAEDWFPCNSCWQTSFTNIAKCLQATLTYYSALWMLYSHFTVTPHISIIILTCMKKLLQWLLAKLHGSILLWKTIAQGSFWGEHSYMDNQWEWCLVLWSSHSSKEPTCKPWLWGQIQLYALPRMHRRWITSLLWFYVRQLVLETSGLYIYLVFNVSFTYLYYTIGYNH